MTTPLVDLEISDPTRFAPEAEVTVQLRLEALSDGIVVDGVLRIPWIGVCRRCLAPITGVAASDVRELYQQVLTDTDAFQIVGEQLDLRPAVRELVLLDAPTVPLCRPDCAGLCPICGTDRNLEDCGCVTVSADPRWAALDALKPTAESADPPG